MTRSSPLPERRTRAAVERLSDAPAPARLGRQHERQMAAPAQAGRRARHDQGRDLEIHDPAQGREGLAVHVSDGGEVGDHASGAGAHAEGAGLLRDFRARVVGQRQDPAGRRVGRWRQELGAGGARKAPILPRRRCASARPWQWNGGPAVLQSRATDDTGMVQPTRAAFIAERGLRGVYHYNAIASWRIDEKGEATNVYA